MTERIKHKWIGWGFDTTICENCRVDLYHPFTVRGEFCDEYAAEETDWKQLPLRKANALKRARELLTEEECRLLGL